jgi:acyl-coenzyme A thioesterase PaaI-like protein
VTNASPERARDRKVGFTSELGLAVTGGADALDGVARILPELCAGEGATLRPSVLLTWADILIGSLANEHTLPRICMTVDLSVRVVTPIPAGVELRSRGRLLKAGRTLTFGETTFVISTPGGGPSDEPAAVALGTFVASPRPEDVSISFVHGEDPIPGREVLEPPEPVTQMLGSRVIGPGVVEVPRHERVLNWADTVQGGAIAACAEEAVLALDRPAVPSELEIRYLGAVREGPMRATASRLGPWARVEVVDLGNDGRPVAIAAARVD